MELSAAGQQNTKLARVGRVNSATLGPAFTRNSLKEEVVLEYVDHFRAQFEALYPGRRPLFLCPRNEAGVRKFVCSTLRPSPVPVRELYEAQACAKFLAARIAYEPLDPPGQPPSCLPSPLFTLNGRAGDSFDLSVLLASLLLGSGYDA